MNYSSPYYKGLQGDGLSEDEIKRLRRYAQALAIRLEGALPWAVRTAAFVVLAVLILGAAGMVGWDWFADYRLYRQIVRSLAMPGQAPTSSFEEFLRYRRALEFSDTAEHLAEREATAEEVRTTLATPDQVEEIDSHYAWFYSGPVFRGHQSETIVMRIDIETSRVTSVGYIHQNWVGTDIHYRHSMAWVRGSPIESVLVELLGFNYRWRFVFAELGLPSQ